MEVHIQLENATWEVMLECILQLQFQVMCAPSNKYAIISIPSAADECVDFIMETILHCWVRSQTKSESLWLKLRQQLNKSTRWPQTVSQWGKLLVKLTKILSQTVYNVELDGTKSSTDGSPTRRPVPGPSNKQPHALSRNPSTSRQQSLTINNISSNSDLQIDKLAQSDGAILLSKHNNKPDLLEVSSASGPNKTSKDEVSPDSTKKGDVPAMMQLIQGIKESVMQEKSNNDSTSTLDYSAKYGYERKMIETITSSPAQQLTYTFHPL